MGTLTRPCSASASRTTYARRRTRANGPVAVEIDDEASGWKRSPASDVGTWSSIAPGSPHYARCSGSRGRIDGDIRSRALPHFSGVLSRSDATRRGSPRPGSSRRTSPNHYPSRSSASVRGAAASKKHPSKGGKNRDVTVYPVLREPEHSRMWRTRGRSSSTCPPSLAGISFHPIASSSISTRHRARSLASGARRTSSAMRWPRHGPRERGPSRRAPRASRRIADPPVRFERDDRRHGPEIRRAPRGQAREELTIVFRVALRGGRVFVDWLRNNPWPP